MENVFDNSRDLPDDLERLQTLRIWHAMWLERIDRRAEELRRRQSEQARGRARRPPTPDWTLELNRATGQPVAVHVGDCGMAGQRKRPVGQDDARRLLTTDGVPACPVCRPDTELHIVDLTRGRGGRGERSPGVRSARRRGRARAGQTSWPPPPPVGDLGAAAVTGPAGTGVDRVCI
ncbi:DUF6233 domain-containing protein [Streptomyces sp. NPDC021562]|uniref:DUF6233 domain-containing protein n=1 Tax=Streptomyces sp. NPDC021562 TaxID=3155121 RepID=UPI0033E3927F